MTAFGDVMPIQTLRALTKAEDNSPTMKDRKRDFTKFIKERIGDSTKPPRKGVSDEYSESIWMSKHRDQ